MKKKKLTVLTGAGVSAESGITTFRDSDGLWENHNVEDVASVQDKIRVEAFASPDFTGTPVARGIFVADKVDYLVKIEVDRGYLGTF